MELESESVYPLQYLSLSKSNQAAVTEENIALRRHLQISALPHSDAKTPYWNFSCDMELLLP
jgi:hypothetical protein